ncbi:MAG: hypothetical protein ACRDF4_08830 [Rhabdochlamydiaceae bacterium]
MTVNEFFKELYALPEKDWRQSKSGAIRRGSDCEFCPITFLTWKKYDRFYDIGEYNIAGHWLGLSDSILHSLALSADKRSTRYRVEMEALLKKE